MGIPAGLHSNVAGIGWPPVTEGAAAETLALLRLLDETQWLPASELVERQLSQLRILLPHLAQQSPQFRRRLEQARLAAADISSIEALRSLPVLTRRDLQVPGADLYCREIPPSHKPLGESRTSGSTGEPVIVRRTKINQLFWSAFNLRSHFWHGTDLSRRCTAIRPQVTTYAITRSRGQPVSQLFETGPMQGIPITTDVAQQVAWMREFQPDSLIVYPTNLEAIVRHCRQQGTTIPGLRLILTIGETLSPAIRQEAESVLSAKVADKYSSQEVGVVAAECLESGLFHIMAEGLIVEVLKDDGSPAGEGETGRVTITDLLNLATPIVRYDIGDYAEVGGACACGRGLPTLRRVLGRERNLLVKPDGTRNWPLVGFARFREVAPVVQYQFIQHELDRIEVRLVTEVRPTPAQESALTDVIREALGFAFRIEFTYFEGEIPRSPGGKFEEFLCRVKPAA